jgi:hypothetical protein
MSSQLHALVHSLEKSERRFLRLYADLGSGPLHGNCLELLDALLDMPSWEEARLLATLTAGPLRDNLSSNKTRLLELILKALRLLHHGKDVRSVLRDYLADIELLLGKSHFQLAQRRLRKAKALARHYEEETIYLQLLHLELRLLAHQPAHLTASILTEEIPDCLTRLQTTEGHYHLYERLRLHARLHGYAQTPEAQANLEAIRADPLLATPPSAPDLRFASLLHHQVIGTYHMLKRELDAAFAVFEPLIARWEAGPDIISHRTQVYLSCLNNYLGTCISVIATQPQFLKTVVSARQLQGVALHARLRAEQVTYVQELNYRFNFSTLDASREFITEIGAWLDAHAPRLDPAQLLSMYHNLALFHFVYGAHKPANAWLQRILHFPDTEARADIHDFAPILQLVLQYELQNFDLTDYLLRNASRRIQRSGKELALETSVLAWFRRLQKVSLQSTAAQRQSLQQLLDQLRALATQPGRPPLGLNELIFWAESHLEGVPLAQHVQRRMFG